jgi:hypothetical protein
MGVMPRVHAGAVLIALVCAACADSPTTQMNPSSDGLPAEFEIGQGELSFAPLQDDEALPYVAGAQGGHHVFVAFRIRHLDPSRTHVAVTTTPLERPDLKLEREGRINFMRDDDAPAEASDAPSYIFPGWPAQILMAPCFVGESARIDVVLTDLENKMATGTRTVRIARPEGGSERDCPAQAMR